MSKVSKVFIFSFCFLSNRRVSRAQACMHFDKTAVMMMVCYLLFIYYFYII